MVTVVLRSPGTTERSVFGGDCPTSPHVWRELEVSPKLPALRR